MAVEISSRKDFEEWFKRKPRDWAQVLALRSALRVLPIALDPENSTDARTNPLAAVTVLRAVAVPYDLQEESDFGTLARASLAAASAAQSVYLETSDRIAALAIATAYRAAASYSAVADSGYAVSAASDASGLFAAKLARLAARTSPSLAYGDREFSDAIVEGAGTHASAAASSEFWRRLGEDCGALERGVPSAALADQPLWRNRPHWFQEAWGRAAQELSRPKKNFEIWREWYFGRLEGLPHAFTDFDNEADKKFYRWLVEKNNEWWSRKPAEVNADIKAFVDSLRTPKDEPDTSVDFFISYASENEAAAREVAAVLDDLGKSYIVQYRDFPQANFVNAMNDAMERSDRLIALYSTDYIASPHCNAEWNYYYNLDPSSVERRIVGLKLDSTDLKPLMQTVNNRDLTQYAPAEREQAIREWIAYEPPTPTRANVGDAVEGLLSPKIAENAEGKLDRQLNPEFDVPQRETALESAVRELMIVLDVALDANHNLPSRMQRSIERYDQEVRASGAKSAWGGLNRLINIIIGGMSTMSSAEFADGQKETLEELVAAHKHCMATLKNPDLEERALSEISMAGVDAEVIKDLTQKLRDMMEPLQEAERTTQPLDDLIEDVIEEGRDVAFLAGAPDADKKEQSSKRRYVMYVGGISLAVLSALSDMTAITASPSTTQAIQVGKELVEAFFKAIGL